jgi:hypothetical protein
VRTLRFHHLDKPGGPAPGVELESQEELLAAHPPQGVTPVGGITQNHAMSTSAAWCAQYFTPTFPAGRTVKSWQVTRVNVRVGRASSVPSTAHFNFQIRAASDAKQPTGAALGGEVVRRDLLPMTVVTTGATPPWLVSPIQFANVTNLDPSKGACVVISLAGGSLSTNGYVGTQTGASPMTPNMHFMQGSGGLTWTGEQQTRDMYIQVYGKYRYVQQ